jgi:hypothetical protein
MACERSPRQVLEMDLLEEDITAAARVEGIAAFVAANAAMARYLKEEGRTPAQFNGRTREGEFIHAFTVANFVKYPNDFPPECLGYEVIKTAGLI